MQYTQLDEEGSGGTNAQEKGSTTAAATTRDKQQPQGFPKHLSEPLTTNESLAAPDDDDDDDDPYYVFRDDLYRKLDLVDEALTHYLRLVNQTDTAVNTHELKDCKKQLKRHVKNAESTLRDVHTTVQVVSSDPSKFSHISATELHDRTSLVTTSQERLAAVRNDMNSEHVKAKFLKDERAKIARRMQQQHEDEKQDEESYFIADSHAKASLLMQQQDETLEELDEAVTRVGVMAGDIHVEIGQQNKMLEEMDDDLADAEEKLGLVMGKLAKMLKTKDKCQLGTILMLSLTVLVLFFLVIYT